LATLLLDPPLYTPQPVIASAPRLPIAAPAAAPVQVPVRREPVNAALSASRGTPSAPSAAPVAASTPAQAQQYKTTGSDTLWGVAQRVEGGTVQQAMLAIQDLNPGAFLDGNINRLKSGQVLRMPDAQQVRSRSHSQAVAQVSAQNRAWSERHAAPARQLDATRPRLISRTICAW
jgi:pilus assembly protein FimV